MKFIPDLSFDGNCAEALDYYKEVFNGEIIQVVTYEEAVIDCPIDKYEKIFTATLVIAKNTLYFSDVFYRDEVINEGKTAIMIEFFNEEEMRILFDNLSKEGLVLKEIEETNWGSLYGSIRDKFGFVWNFNFEMCII